MKYRFSLEAKIPIRCYLFHKGRLKIMVSKFYSLQGSELQPIAQSSFVEISCIVSSGGQVKITHFEEFYPVIETNFYLIFRKS